MTTATTDPAVQQVIADAKAAGTQLITDARDAAHSMLTHIATEATAAVPHVTTAIVDVLVDFIPSNLRPIVAPLLSAATANTSHVVAVGMTGTIQRALGIALLRIDAVLGTTTHGTT
jgi:hypothetical protein